jgi:hypothetical protein
MTCAGLSRWFQASMRIVSRFQPTRSDLPGSSAAREMPGLTQQEPRLLITGKSGLLHRPKGVNGAGTVHASDQIVYLTKMSGTGGAGMLGLIWNPV